MALEFYHDVASSRPQKKDSRHLLCFQAAANSKYFDDYYTYDKLHRLKAFDRGNLTGTAPNYTGIAGTPANEQDWTLDQLGNWTPFIQPVVGRGSTVGRRAEQC